MTSLALLQLVSPALPVGAFSYSEGLEVLIQAGSIADEQAIQAWLEAELQRGAVRLEAAALRPLVEALVCLLYTSPSPRDKRQSRMPSSA